MIQPMSRETELFSQVDVARRTPSATLMPPLALTIASVPLAIQTGDEAILDYARDYYREYLTPRARPILSLSVGVLRGREGLWEDEDAEFHSHGDGWVRQRDFAAHWRGDRVHALLSPEISDGLHNLLRWVLPGLLLPRRAFLLHGGAVVDGSGGAHVFFGVSGAGKSTCAGIIQRLDPAARLLGDDAVIVAVENGVTMAFAAPLGCGYSRGAPPPLAAPLRSLCALRQSRRTGLEPLAPGRGAALLLGSAMGLDFLAEGEARLALAEEFARSAPGVSRLEFQLNGDFWPLMAGKAGSHGR